MRPLLCAAAVLASGLVVGIVAPPGAATEKTPGDGCLVVANGYGKVTVKLTRGVVFGRLDEGTVTIDDLAVDDGAVPSVYGAPGVKLGEHRKQYAGSFIRFRTKGAVRISIEAQAMNLSVVGKGAAWLSSFGLDVLPPDNVFSADEASFCEDNFQPLPVELRPSRVAISTPSAG